jgi:hypothetical protein
VDVKFRWRTLGRGEGGGVWRRECIKVFHSSLARIHDAMTRGITYMHGLPVKISSRALPFSHRTRSRPSRPSVQSPLQHSLTLSWRDTCPNLHILHQSKRKSRSSYACAHRHHYSSLSPPSSSLHCRTVTSTSQANTLS